MEACLVTELVALAVAVFIVGFFLGARVMLWGLEYFCRYYPKLNSMVREALEMWFKKHGFK